MSNHEVEVELIDVFFHEDASMTLSVDNPSGGKGWDLHLAPSMVWDLIHGLKKKLAESVEEEEPEVPGPYPLAEALKATTSPPYTAPLCRCTARTPIFDEVRTPMIPREVERKLAETADEEILKALKAAAESDEPGTTRIPIPKED